VPESDDPGGDEARRRVAGGMRGEGPATCFANQVRAVVSPLSFVEDSDRAADVGEEEGDDGAQPVACDPRLVAITG